VAELQQGGAGGEAITEAMEGIDLATVLELLRSASGLYREWGNVDRAEACGALAEFYGDRWSVRTVTTSRRGVEKDEQAARREREEMIHKLADRVAQLEAELKEVKQALRRLMSERR